MMLRAALIVAAGAVLAMALSVPLAKPDTGPTAGQITQRIVETIDIDPATGRPFDDAN